MDYAENMLSREQRHCYSYIEIIIQWEGRLTLQHLQQEFGFGRSKAKKMLSEYVDLQPNKLVYDASLKGHKPSNQFTPAYTRGHIDEYCRSELSDVIGIQLLEAPLRNIDPNLIRPVLRAIRYKQRLDIGYQSLSSPDWYLMDCAITYERTVKKTMPIEILCYRAFVLSRMH